MIVKLTRVAPGHYTACDGRFVIRGSKGQGWSITDSSADRPRWAYTLPEAYQTIASVLSGEAAAKAGQ